MKTIPLIFPALFLIAAPLPHLRAADIAAPAKPAAPAAPVVTAKAGDLPVHLKFSDPTKAGTVRLKLAWGHVTVTAADQPDVVVVSNIKSKQQERQQKAPDGLRRLDSEVSYSAAEKDNVITLDFGGDLAGPTMSGADVALTVPRRTSIIISSAFGGNVDVKGVAGDVEVHDMNGKITLDHVSGSALVETMNGKIHASFTKVSSGKPLSFTSMNGPIEVWVPDDTKANVRLRTQNGAIYTDFSDKALVTKTEAASGHFPKVKVKPHPAGTSGDDWRDDVHDAVREATRQGLEAAREALEAAREAAQAAREGVADATGKPVPPMPPFHFSFGSPSGGKVVTGTLNGGGPEIQIATMNGTITLRKLKP